MRTLSELSQSSGIPLILQAGTHLGYVRMGGILPWDDDVDLWVYNVVGNDFVFWNKIVCPNSALYPLENIHFEGFVFQQPGNTEEVLNSRYVDWKTMIRVYPWIHRLEQGGNPMFDYPITILNYM